MWQLCPSRAHPQQEQSQSVENGAARVQMTLAPPQQAVLSVPHNSISHVVLLRHRDKVGTPVHAGHGVHFLAKCIGNFFASSISWPSACIALGPTDCQCAFSRPLAKSARNVPWMSVATQGGSRSPGAPGPLHKRQNLQALAS
eukprot:438190-Amphidinium_carterae.1